MPREIVYHRDRKIVINEVNEQYFALQQSVRGDYSQYHTIQKLISKEPG